MHRFLPLFLSCIFLAGCSFTTNASADADDIPVEEEEDITEDGDGTFAPDEISDVSEENSEDTVTIVDEPSETFIPPNVDSLLLDSRESEIPNSPDLDSYTVKDYLAEFFLYLKDHTLVEVKAKAKALSLTYSDGFMKHLKEVSEDSMEVSLPHLEVYEDRDSEVIYNIEVEVSRTNSGSDANSAVDVYSGTVTLSEFGIVKSCVLDLKRDADEAPIEVDSEQPATPQFIESGEEPGFEESDSDELQEIVRQLEQPVQNTQPTPQPTPSNPFLEQNDTDGDSPSWFFY